MTRFHFSCFLWRTVGYPQNSQATLAQMGISCFTNGVFMFTLSQQILLQPAPFLFNHSDSLFPQKLFFSFSTHLVTRKDKDICIFIYAIFTSQNHGNALTLPTVKNREAYWFSQSQCIITGRQYLCEIQLAVQGRHKQEVITLLVHIKFFLAIIIFVMGKHN